MKILFLVSKAVLGGHILSAFTVARYIKKQGHDVFFGGGAGKLTVVIEQQLPFIEIPIPFFHGQLPTYFTWQSLQTIRHLRRVIRGHDFDLIHAFDARAYIHGSIAALLERKYVTCTLCGGTDPQYNIPLARKIIAFSEEQRDKMIGEYKWAPEYVDVIRTRLDIDKITNDTASLPVALNLQPDFPTIMMISSFDGTKSASIRQVMKVLSRLALKKIPFQMVFIGGKGAFFEEMKLEGEKLNDMLQRKVLFFTGPVIDAFRLLRQATIVLGVGRSAFEGMCYRKPTLIVGENGFAGTVSRENIREIAYYNFSGRNQTSPCPVETFTEVVVKLLRDESSREILGNFGYDFVVNEIDVKHGITKIEDVYRAVIERRTTGFRLRQWLSVFCIMIPIWRDNVWHTVGMPLKKALKKVR